MSHKHEIWMQWDWQTDWKRTHPPVTYWTHLELFHFISLWLGDYHFETVCCGLGSRKHMLLIFCSSVMPKNGNWMKQSNKAFCEMDSFIHWWHVHEAEWQLHILALPFIYDCFGFQLHRTEGFCRAAVWVQKNADAMCLNNRIEKWEHVQHILLHNYLKRLQLSTEMKITTKTSFQLILWPTFPKLSHNALVYCEFGHWWSATVEVGW